MSSTTSAALTALKAAIGTASGLTGLVSIGRPSQTPARKSAHIYGITIETTLEATLSRYRRYLRCAVTVYTGAVAVTPEARVLAAVDLVDDVLTVIEADRTLGGVVLDTVATATATDEGEIPGDATIEIECWWHATTGV